MEFTRTYLELYFTDQYQKQSLETDPVMHIRFPRAFAAGKKEYQGRTYHFYTKGSLQDFEKAPSQYIETEDRRTGHIAKSVALEAEQDK